VGKAEPDEAAHSHLYY